MPSLDLSTGTFRNDPGQMSGREFDARRRAITRRMGADLFTDENKDTEAALKERGLTGMKDAAGRLVPSGTQLTSEGRADPASLADSLMQVDQTPLTPDRQLKAAASERSRINTVLGFHKAALKEFHKGEGKDIDFQDDGSGKQIDVGPLAGQLAGLREKSNEKVGMLKGAFTPGISAGDPTDEARAAAGQIPAVEKQYNALLAKRQRIVDEHDRVKAAADVANKRYEELVGSTYGLKGPDMRDAVAAVNTDRKLAGAAPVAKIDFPDATGDDWLSQRVNQVNTERRLAGQKPINPASVQLTDTYPKEAIRPIDTAEGQGKSVAPGALQSVAAARTQAMGPEVVPGQHQLLELEDLKKSGVTHVGSEPIDKYIQQFGGSEAVDDAKAVSAYTGINKRLADIKAALPGMTDKGAAPLLDEQAVLTKLLDKRTESLKARGLWDQVRDPSLVEKLVGFNLNTAKGIGGAAVDTLESAARNAPGITTVMSGGLNKAAESLLPESVQKQHAEQDKQAQAKIKEFAGAMREEAEGWNQHLPKQLNDKINNGFFTGDVARGTGSTIAFMGPATIMGGAAKAMQLSDAAAELLMKATIASTGAASESNSFRREAEQHLQADLDAGKITKEEFNRSAGMAELFGAAAGSTEAFTGLSNITRRLAGGKAGTSFLRKLFDVAGKGGLEKTATWLKGPGARALKESASEIIEEMGQEFGQNLGEEIYASKTFDKGRKVTGQDASDAAASAGVSTAIVSLISQAIGLPISTRRYRNLNEAIQKGAAERRAAGGPEQSGGTAPAVPVKPGGPLAPGGAPLVTPGKSLVSPGEPARPSQATPAAPADTGDEVQVDEELAGDLGRSAKVQPNTPAAPAAEKPDYQYTVQRDIGEGADKIPGYTQIDEIRGDKSVRSSTLEKLRAEGVDLPDVPAHLPTGRYMRGDIVKASRPAGQIHDKSSTQLTLPPTEAKPFTDFGKAIPDADIYTDPKDGSYGRETEPHITALYGINNDDVEPVRKALADVGPITVKLGAVSSFENADKPYDVLKVSVASPQLHAANAAIKAATDNSSDFPDYKPHLTLAYVKKGLAKKYVGSKDFAGKTITLHSLSFRDRQGKSIEIPLGKTAEATKPVGPEVTFSTKIKNAKAEVAVAKLDDGKFRYAANSEHHTGTMTGFGSPIRKENQQFDTQDEATTAGLRDIINHNIGVANDTSSNSTDAQKANARTLIAAAQGRLEGLGHPALARPAIHTGENTPRNFLHTALEASKTPNGKPVARFLGDFTRRLNRAAPEAFKAMRVVVHDQKQWDAHPELSQRTPDSSAAYSPATNTLHLNSGKLTAENVGSAIVHEAGHFAEKFYLGEDFTKGEWSKLSHKDRVAAWNAYSGEKNTATELGEDEMLADREARTEWVAMQFARVVRGDTQGMSAALKAKLTKFLKDIREVVNKWVGNEKLTTPELDAKILQMLNYEDATPPTAPKAGKAAPAVAKPKVSDQLKKLGDDLFGAPKDKGTQDMFEGGQHTGATDFTLQGEQATDFEGVTAKKEALAEAKKKQEAAQGDLSGAPAEFGQKFDPEKVEAANKFVTMLVREHPEVRSKPALAAFLDENFPKAKPFSESIFRILGGFADVDETGSFSEAYSSRVKPASPVEPGTPSSARTGLAPESTGQGPRTENVGQNPKKGKTISVGLPAHGEPDILNEIERIGGVTSKESAINPGGEYDGFNEAFSSTARLLIRRNAGQKPDQVARDLHEEGHLAGDDTNALYAAVEKAVAARRAADKTVSRKQYEDRFDRAFLGNEHPREWLRAGKAITVDDLNGGDTFEVEGEKFTVKAIDEDGNVTIEDGITRVVPPGTPVYPDRGIVKKAKGSMFPTKPHEPSPDTNLEPDRPPAGPRDGGGPAGVQSERTADGAPERPVGAQPPAEAQSGAGTSDAAVARADSDSSLPQREPGAVGPEDVPAGGEQPGGGVGAGETGILDFAGADFAVDHVPAERPGGDVVAASRDQSVADRIKAQRAAESVPVTGVNLENIAATLPMLLPEQHDDVLKAERRLLENDKKGMLFTNGTGTGKTYTGLGIIKRQLKRGKKNVLILVPSFKKALDWVQDGKRVGVPSAVLEDTVHSGKGVTVTTYANFRLNQKLRNRDFDLLVYDESHKLMENEAGSATSGFDAHREITNHPDVLERKVTERFFGPRPAVAHGIGVSQQEINDSLDKMHAWESQVAQNRGKIQNEMERLGPLTKAVFLSATPFAYHKSLRYAEGYLFDAPDTEGGKSYNEASGFDKFLVENFGYRMRYNKLTQPESGVNIDMMEMAFADRLMKEGAMSGRGIDVPYDYSREFVLVDPGLGAELDRGIGVLTGWVDKLNKWKELPEISRARFDYHYTQKLMEAIKANQSIARIKEHLALGRKVIIGHSYVHALPSHPFRGLSEHALSKEGLKEVAEFEAKYPELVNMDFGRMTNPLDLLKQEFGNRIVFYNGTVSQGKRMEAIKNFNDDNSGTDIIVGQIQAIKEGVSLHDETGVHPRVEVNLHLPIRPTDASQFEGRSYRIGQHSNSPYEYIVIHTDTEKFAFGQKINERVLTPENLALGSGARSLQDSFKNGYLNPVDAAPSADQGKGGKEADRRAGRMTDYDRAKSYYFGRQKKTQKNKSAEGIDYYATPEPIGSKMADWLDAQPNESLLEPSVGHGAIGRFFPQFTTNHFVDSSYDLANEARIKIQDGTIHTKQFEDFDIHNKADGIAMNPPFGHGGSTAMKHLAKAVRHLNNGGRIVALIPEGPAADEAFNKLYESLPSNVIKRAEFGLPTVTFERAGTAVKTRIVVLDRIDDNRKRSEAAVQSRRDIAADDINELFDKFEHLEVPPRVRGGLTQNSQYNTPVAAGVSPLAPATRPENNLGDFGDAQFPHTKTGKTVFVAKTNRFLGDRFQQAKVMAVKHGGYYSAFKGVGAVPGFHFPTEAQRDAFIIEWEDQPIRDVPDTPGDTVGTPAEPEKVVKNEKVEDQPGYRYRSHPDTLINAGLATARQIYQTKGLEGTDAAAKAFVDQVGEGAAADAIFDRSIDLPERVKTAIGVRLEHALARRRFDDKLDPKDRAAAKRQYARLTELMAERGTEFGQGIQAYDLVNRYGPDGALQAATRSVKSRQEKIVGPGGIKLTQQQLDTLNKINEGAIEDATNDLRSALRGIKVGRSIWKQYQESAAQSWLKRIQSNLGELAESPPLKEFTDRLVREVRAKIDAALPPGEKPAPASAIATIGEAINNREKYKEAWDAARAELEEKYADRPEILERLDEQLGGILDKPFSAKTLDRAIKDAHNAMGVTVRDIVRMHYSQADALGQSLADKLVDQAKLKPDDAARLADNIKSRFADLTKEAKAKALAKLGRGKGGIQKRIAQLADKMITLSNLGALHKAEYFDAVAHELGLPELTEATAAKLRDLGEKVQKAPQGFQYDRAVTDLLNELQKIRGIGKVDVATAIYYAHILSGYTTQMVNGISTALNTLADTTVMLTRNPGSVARAVGGLKDGAANGFVHAMSILDTGYSHRHFDDKVPEVSNTLEILSKDPNRNISLRGYSHLLKYVGRAMKAADAVFYYSASEAYQRVAAANLAAHASDGQMPRQELNRQIRDMLAISPSDFEAARAQARQEGHTGLDYQLRVAELIQQKRDPKLVEAGHNFGLNATFNNAPRGYLGVVAKYIGELSQKVPAIKLFVPFTNIVSNVTNASLNYSPLGISRAIRGYGTEEAPGPEERGDLLIKGIAGTLGLTALLAYAVGGGDDKDKMPWITANGPSDPHARNQLRNTGWKPHSIKIGGVYVSYLESPAALPLALVGNYIDAVHYNKLDEKSVGDMLTSSLGGMTETLFNMSFLQGLGNLMDVVRGKPGAAKQFVQNTVQNAVPVAGANLVRQVDRTFDPKLYEQNGLKGLLTGGIPGLRQMAPERLDVVGKPIESRPTDRFGRLATNDKLWDTLAEKQAFIPEVSKATKLGGEKITPDQYRQMVKESGPAIERRLRAALPALQYMNQEKADDFVQKIATEEHKRAKSHLRRTFYNPFASK